MEIVDYQRIRKELAEMGVLVLAQKRARELQLQISEPNAPLPYEDAVEMAYWEHKELERVY